MINQPSLLNEPIGLPTEDGSNPRTTSAYRADLVDYLSFARSGGYVARPDLPRNSNEAFLPATAAGAAAFIDALRRRGMKLSTIRRRIAALTNDRRMRGGKGSYWRDPHVKRAWTQALIEDERGHQRKLALVDNGVRAVIAAMDAGHLDATMPTQRTALLYLRDRALILAMFFGALTRTEAATLYLENVIPAPDIDGVRLRVNTSGDMKDERGSRVWVNPFRTRDISIHRAADPTFCAVTAIERWRRLLETKGATQGYFFRGVLPNGVVRDSVTGRQIQEVLKERSRRAGESADRISSHSLRSGITATIALRGGSDEIIRERTGLTKLDSMHDVIGRARKLAGSKRAEDFIRL